MALSLLKFFKRKGAKEQAPTAPTPVVEKPSSERLSKTVMPNATRNPAGADPFHQASSLAVVNETPAPAPPKPIPLSVPAPTAPALSPIPPAVALALEPKIERAIPFALSDVIAQMPAGVVRPLSDNEGSRRVLLKAAELERGMANGKPSVSIATVYEQVPEIFTRPIAPADAAQVVLPFAKVLEQFTSVQMRADQYREQAVPQVETPFLKVTLEDDTKFGTKTGPLESGSLAPVRVLPATAETIAAAEPEPASTERPIPTPVMPAPDVARNGNRPASANGNGHSNGNGATAEAFQEQAPSAPAPTRIPFKLTPNGTGVTAAERVPASTGGTSVPTSSQSAAPLTATPPAPAAPTRIPFKLTPPPEDGAVKGEPWLTKENFAAASEAAPLQAATPARVPAKVTQKISLPLKPILEALPPFQLTGDVKSVSNATRIELPFALVESQLASGRVHLTPEDFAAALPEEHRSLFTAKDIATPVMLPLQDVLQNLPGAALRMRDDQEEQERGSNFATPFSATAEEDARRFNVASEPVAKPAFSLATPVAQIEVAPPPAVVVAPATPPAEAPEPEPAPARVLKLPRAKLPTRKERTPLQKALDTDESVEPKAVVTHIQKMDGVEGCAIMFGDGLNLAGELPEAYEADGLCAMAPSLVQRIENHMVETKLGALSGMTLSCTEASISFFMHDNLCLAAVHKEGSLGRDVRARLDAIVQELSKTYSQPA